MAHVELQQLYRSFGPVTALQGIDLALETAVKDQNFPP